MIFWFKLQRFGFHDGSPFVSTTPLTFADGETMILKENKKTEGIIVPKHETLSYFQQNSVHLGFIESDDDFSFIITMWEPNKNAILVRTIENGALKKWRWSHWEKRHKHRAKTKVLDKKHSKCGRGTTNFYISENQHGTWKEVVTGHGVIEFCLLFY